MDAYSCTTESPVSMDCSSPGNNFKIYWQYPAQEDEKIAYPPIKPLDGTWGRPTTKKVRTPYIVDKHIYWGDRLEIYTIPDSPTYYYRIFDGLTYECGWMLASSKEEAGEKVWEFYQESVRLRLAHDKLAVIKKGMLNVGA